MKRKILALFLALSIVFTLAACGGGGTKRASAESVVTAGLDAFKTFDEAKIAEIWGKDAINETSEETSEEIDLDSREFITLAVKNLSYKIVSSEEKEDTATVKAEITNTDMQKVLTDMMGEAFLKMLSYAFLPEDQQPTEEETSAMFLDIVKDLMSKDDLATVTKTVDIPLTLQENEWKINSNDEIIDAIFGGMFSFDFEAEEDAPEDQIGKAYDWLVGDIWNKGICDMSHYYYDGKSSTGETMDADFTMSQLNKAMAEKDTYNEIMNNLPEEYAEFTSLWEKIMGQVDVLYAEIQARGTEVTGAELDTGLFSQYFNAFVDLYFDL